ncbi:MAG TPA: ABC transporter ATP-binding protein [Candidatus Saccharimonadales bacterium]|nr:ABC transporter ATP-binding protein [Candidatus Saccharimonadales bacterium]
MDQEEQFTKPNIKSLRLYLSYWRLAPFYTFLGVIFSLALALQSTVIPLLIALTLGQLVSDGTVNVALMVAAAVIQVVILIFGYLSDKYGVALLHDRVAKRLYEDCFRYLVHQDYGFFANRFSGSIVNQASRFAKSYTFFNDVVFFNLLPQQLFAALIIVSVMMYYSLPIGALVLILWLLSIWLVVKFAIQRLPLRRSAVAKESEQIGELADMVTNILTVKTFGAEERELKRYREFNRHWARLFLRSWRRAVRNAWVIEAICGFMQLGVFIGGILAVKHGSIGIATFLLFQVYILKMIDNISRSVFMVRQLEAVSGDAQEMTELLELSPLVQDKPFAEKSHIKKGVITLQNVTFQYEDAAADTGNLFSDFNLKINSGERIGLVGPSGGGKTTITRLLLRFMDIQGGSITIDGQDIRDVKQQELRRAIAYVSQEPVLFHRSIKENIRYGRPGASDKEIIAVAKKAFAHDFIKVLPEGYDTLVGERGVKLSGGQRQRVAIARAMLSGAPIIILDEATSALDSESERVIQKALWELMKGRTAVVIAHRLSTIQKMDRIVVIDEGKIIEEGSHTTLLARKGLYARLWSHQSGGFIENQ